jgi:LacI family transcriptional regulator
MANPATIKDVAKMSGLSIATISKYINGGSVRDKNRAIIADAIGRLDYRVNEIAQGLKTNKTKTVGILIPTLDRIFYSAIISVIEDILLKNGYSTIICTYMEDENIEKTKIQFLVNKMVDGIVLMPFDKSSAKLLEISRKNIPVVVIDQVISDSDCDTVVVDNLNASYNAVEHLITEGHKRIGIICGPENVYTAQERQKGYIRVMEDYSIKIDKMLIKNSDYKFEGGYKMMMELLEQKPVPTAVFVTNYEMTLGAVVAINEKNISIPEQLSFIGFDNMQMAEVVKPPLSIVVQPVRQIGAISAEILLKRLKGDFTGFPAFFRLKTDMLIRKSVKKI